jgi:hypothetical protein
MDEFSEQDVTTSNVFALNSRRSIKKYTSKFPFVKFLKSAGKNVIRPPFVLIPVDSNKHALT